MEGDGRGVSGRWSQSTVDSAAWKVSIGSGDWTALASLKEVCLIGTMGWKLNRGSQKHD